MASWNSFSVLDLAPMEEAFGQIDGAAKAAFRLFLTTTRPLLTAIQVKLLAGDLAGAAASAHAAKGAANVTGAFRLGALCAEINLRIRQGDREGAQAMMTHIADAFGDVQAAIEALNE